MVCGTCHWGKSLKEGDSSGDDPEGGGGAVADDEDEEVFGDFEDLETGETFKGRCGKAATGSVGGSTEKAAQIICPEFFLDCVLRVVTWDFGWEPVTTPVVTRMLQRRASRRRRRRWRLAATEATRTIRTRKTVAGRRQRSWLHSSTCRWAVAAETMMGTRVARRPRRPRRTARTIVACRPKVGRAGGTHTPPDTPSIAPLSSSDLCPQFAAFSLSVPQSDRLCCSPLTLSFRIRCVADETAERNRHEFVRPQPRPRRLATSSCV